MECHEKLKMVGQCCKVLKDITCSYHQNNEEKVKKARMARDRLRVGSLAHLL